MRHTFSVALGLMLLVMLLGSGARLRAQQENATGRCATPDSIAVTGNDPTANAFIDSTTHGQFYVGAS